MQRPIFFDPTGRRRRWTRRAIFAAIAVLIITALAFATTVATVPASQPLKLGFERPQPLPLRTQVGRLSRSISNLFGRRSVRAVTQSQNLTVGFYSPFGGGALESLKRQVGQLDWIAPTLMSIDHQGNFIAGDNAPMRRVLAGQVRRPLVVDVVQNVANGIWDGPATTRALANPVQRASLVRSIDAALDANNDAGVMIDFEAMPPAGIAVLRQFLGELHARLAPKHRLVSVTVPIDDEAWNVRSFAQVADKVVLMAYDEHYMTGTPGPIASNAWFVSHMSDALKGVPANKVIVALGSYAYDWHGGDADPLTVEEAWLSALDSGTRPFWDKNSGNAGFAFNDDNDANPATPGIRHDVWILDAATSWNQMQVLGQMGINSVALWRLGSEDPGFWAALSSWRQGGGRGGKPLPNLGALREMTNVDIEGNGEILRVDAVPRAGNRTLNYDPHSALVLNEAYDQLPMPYVVRRTGDKPKQIALTFDDGPDPKYTPQILSVLERYHVPGTFFVIGENGVENRGLLQREVADGNEVGNHSYTHPNMADVSDTGIRLELNATQRLIEAYTGRSTRLFRAPYFGDAEPSTPDELGPALIAQQQGYTIVGLHGDPGDWQKRTADDIYQRTVNAVEQATPDLTVNVVLLHDGGGDRSQTVLALPRIIEKLRADGYTFVPASALAGLNRDAVMPKVEGWDLVAVRLDVGIFAVLAALLSGLKWMFFFAIALGVIRALGMTTLALFADRDEDMQPPVEDGGGDGVEDGYGDAFSHPLVSVIIPAFNEERVIESSVRRILASGYHPIEVIVADDGSKDRTSEIVAAAFGDNPSVRLMTMVNGGKARALNRALAQANGEIIVALDADTQFEPETIARLVRWFSKEDIGAVAGNAKVGNRVNIVTRWQAVEYITAQNIERRALTRFDAIMVVPGAVGAWRRSALEDVGGYPEDTLAEDQDLTIAIQRHGWKIAYDEDAVAWTEAPETLRALGKQRFRWAYGTLQCLWKHRSVLRERSPSGLAFVGMPQAWLFQIVFAMISPLIDLALAVSIVGTIVRISQHGWAQTQSDVLRMGIYWIGFTAIDVACGWVAYRLDVREKHYPALLLLAQRFVYRQLMYGVVIRAVGAAFAGLGIGWGKLERTGRVNTQG